MEPPDQDPTNYKMKTFYYNPADKRLIVRSCYTNRFILNYAKPWAWILTVLLLILLAGGFYTKIMGIK